MESSAFTICPVPVYTLCDLNFVLFTRHFLIVRHMIININMSVITAGLLLALCCIGFCFAGSVNETHVVICPFSPSLWCSSVEIAAKCQVLKQCGFHKLKTSTPSSTKKVKMTLYSESLCPDCKHFIVGQLWPVFKELSSIMDLDMIPYGNAQETKQNETSWAYRCQHGQAECVGNLIQTCSINLLGNANRWMPFIYCMENTLEVPEVSAPKCAENLGINYTPIKTCAEGPMGNRMEHKMAIRTELLQPQHTYVPWVTLFGHHTEDIQRKAENDLLRLICDNYNGPVPEPCKPKITSHSKNVRLP